MAQIDGSEFLSARRAGFLAGVEGASSDSCPFLSAHDLRGAWFSGWCDGAVGQHRRRLRERILTNRGVICDLHDFPGRDWQCNGTGSQIHEVFVTRAMVRGARKQLEYGVFCEENCVFLCSTCHSHAGQADVRLYLLEKQRARGYVLDAAGLWPGILQHIKSAPNVL